MSGSAIGNPRSTASLGSGINANAINVKRIIQSYHSSLPKVFHLFTFFRFFH